MKASAKILSYLFHPIFILAFSLFLLLHINPFLFSLQDPKDKVIVIFSITMLTVIFPLIAISMMRFLGLLTDIEMKKREQRIIPLIITGFFYMWLFINVRNNGFIPSLFSAFTLGSTISIFLAFFINNFSKISLHTVGMGGLVAIILLMKINFTFQSFVINTGIFGHFSIHLNILLVAAIILAGLIGTARKYVGQHTNQDLYGGYFVGFISQIIAYQIIF